LATEVVDEAVGANDVGADVLVELLHAAAKTTTTAPRRDMRLALIMAAEPSR
jgi:hypothetical protein